MSTEKRALMAMALSIGVLLIYSTIFPKPKPIVRQSVTENKLNSDAPALPQSQGVSTSAGFTVDASRGKDEAVGVQRFTVSNDTFDLTFSNIGASLEDIYLKDYQTHISGNEFLVIEEFKDAPFSFSQSGDTITFVYAAKGVKVEKIFTVSNGSYKIGFEAKITNTSNQPVNYSPHLFNSLVDLSKLNSAEDSRHNSQFLEFVISLPASMLRSNISRTNQVKEVPGQQINWVGSRDRYFCSILVPTSTAAGYFTKPIEKKILASGVYYNCPVAPGAACSLSAALYAGPQDIAVLKGYGDGIEQIVAFGFFSAISQFILKILDFLHRIIPNWGVCIIILSFLISGVLYPITFKSLKSMRQMQMLQPEIEKLRKAYKDQPQKLNQEVMELYRKYKINPLGGCLPLVLQIPVFVALYQALMRSIVLKGSSFLWIKDLSQPDRLFLLPQSLPVIGNEINLLPLIMAGAMFVQQKMSAQNTASASPEQQKMMMILFPILFGFMFYKFPSGLTLYWTCYTILSIITQKSLFKAKS